MMQEFFSKEIKHTEFKDSPLGRMPKNWEVVTVRNVATSIVPSRNKPKTFGGDIPWITITDIDELYVTKSKSNLAVSRKVLQEAQGKTVPSGTVIMSVAGQFGISTVAAKELVINQQLHGFVCNERICPLYLCLQLRVQKYQIQKLATQTTISYLNKENAESILIPLPPIDQQKKIVLILRSALTVIEKIETEIEKLLLLKKGMMQELLIKGIENTEFKASPIGSIPTEWRVSKLGELFDFKNGVNKEKEFFGKGVPIISYKNVHVGEEVLDADIVTKVDLSPEEVERYSVKYGDVFFTRTSETPEEIGFSNIYLGTLNNAVYNGFVIRARPITRVLSVDFCKYAFLSNSIRTQMIKSCKYTTRAGIGSESLSNILLAVPPLQEQERIAKVISSIHKKLLILSNKLKITKDLKTALMQDLLTGKIRVKVD